MIFYAQAHLQVLQGRLGAQKDQLHSAHTRLMPNETISQSSETMWLCTRLVLAVLFCEAFVAALAEQSMILTRRTAGEGTNAESLAALASSSAGETNASSIACVYLYTDNCEIALLSIRSRL